MNRVLRYFNDTASSPSLDNPSSKNLAKAVTIIALMALIGIGALGLTGVLQGQHLISLSHAFQWLTTINHPTLYTMTAVGCCALLALVRFSRMRLSQNQLLSIEEKSKQLLQTDLITPCFPDIWGYPLNHKLFIDLQPYEGIWIELNLNPPIQTEVDYTTLQVFVLKTSTTDFICSSIVKSEEDKTILNAKLQEAQVTIKDQKPKVFNFTPPSSMESVESLTVWQSILADALCNS